MRPPLAASGRGTPDRVSIRAFPALCLAGLVLSSIAACGGARAPATASPAGSAAPAAPVADLPPVDPAATAARAADAGPAPADVPAAAPTKPAASGAGDDHNAGPSLVFDLNSARSGPSKLAFLVNVEAFRANPAGRQLGSALATIPEWKVLLKDGDLGVAWVLFTSGSLDRPERGTLLGFCTAPDAKIDRWLDARRTATAAPVDAGPGVHATAGSVAGLDRVFLHPQPHVVAIVPPESAVPIATLLRTAHLPAHADPGEAFRIRMRDPRRLMSELSVSVTEIRFWVAPRKDEGADLFLEGEAPGAGALVQQVQELLNKEYDARARTATLGLLDHPDFTTDGDVARMHIRASLTQLAAILQLFVAKIR